MQFSGKRVVLLGFGGEARAALAYLKRIEPDAIIAIADKDQHLRLSAEESAAISAAHLGPEWLSHFEKYDVVIRTPGVPLSALTVAHQLGLQVTSGTNLFLEKNRQKTWAVTGTKGKSTTSSLLFELFRSAGKKVTFGGNIGIPALSMIDSPSDLFVLELSSYQLEDCNFSPHGAIFLNLFSEHLDHHGNEQTYGEAKSRISAFQSAEDFLVLPSANERLKSLTCQSAAQRVCFGATEDASWIEDRTYHMRRSSGAVERVCALNETKLKGPGNTQNILAALAALSQFDIPKSLLAKTICEFSPLPHRLEELPPVAGVGYVNDSISTVPEATINALETFGERVKTLILGGFDRGLSYDTLAQYLMETTVETVLFFPPSGARIQAAIERACKDHGKRMQFFSVKNMEQVATLAREVTPEGALCLLSPAAPSFPIFRNFEERGELFKRAVCG